MHLDLWHPNYACGNHFAISSEGTAIYSDIYPDVCQISEFTASYTLSRAGVKKHYQLPFSYSHGFMEKLTQILVDRINCDEAFITVDDSSS